MLAHFGKDSVPETVIPKINQESLAEMIGTTRPRVSFFHESVQEIGIHSLQRRWVGSPQLVSQCCSPRLGSARKADRKRNPTSRGRRACVSIIRTVKSRKKAPSYRAAWCD